MKKLILAALVSLSLPTLALAAGKEAAPLEKGDKSDKRAERAERGERRARMMLVVGLAEALELSEGEAIRLADRTKGFDEKRRPIKEEMRDGMKILKRAAENDAAALPQVDGAIAKVLEARRKLADLDKEMFTALSRDLSPQKKAKLALFMVHFKQGMKDGHGPGKGGRGGRGKRGH